LVDSAWEVATGTVSRAVRSLRARIGFFAGTGITLWLFYLTGTVLGATIAAFCPPRYRSSSLSRLPSSPWRSRSWSTARPSWRRAPRWPYSPSRADFRAASACSPPRPPASQRA
jgi:hypothetical protein